MDQKKEGKKSANLMRRSVIGLVLYLITKYSESDGVEGRFGNGGGNKWPGKVRC